MVASRDPGSQRPRDEAGDRGTTEPGNQGTKEPGSQATKGPGNQGLYPAAQRSIPKVCQNLIKIDLARNLDSNPS